MNIPKTQLTKIADLFDKYYESYQRDDQFNRSYINQAESILADIGYNERFNGGTYRDVYGSDCTVVKIASTKKQAWGSKQTARDENKSEIRNNTRISNATIEDVAGEGQCSGQKYITDIMDYEVGKNRWLVMERAEVTDNNVTPEMANKIQNALSSANPRGIHISEISPINMGRKDGIPVIFDYAGT